MGDKAVQTVLLRVDGMTCGGCEQRIGRVLARLDGVRETSADHRTGEVRVAFDPGQVAPGGLAERIAAAGYRVTGSEEATS